MFGAMIGALAQGTAAAQSAEASVDATERDLYFKNLALDEQERQYGLQSRLYDPFVRQSQQAIPQLQQGAAGLNISQLLGYAPYQQAVEEAQAETMGAVGARGLRRSNFGINQVASAGTNTLSNINNLLNQRAQSIAGQAQTGSFALGNRGATTTGNISSILQSQGATAAANARRLGNIQTQLGENMANIGAATLDYYR